MVVTHWLNPLIPISNFSVCIINKSSLGNMSSLASYPKANANSIGKEGIKEEKSFPRSSSPTRAVDDEEVIEWKKEGMTTRSAKRKAVAEQIEKGKSYIKQR